MYLADYGTCKEIVLVLRASANEKRKNLIEISPICVGVNLTTSNRILLYYRWRL